ncbi:MAG: twin-arginine translocase TatA/TatE family subunit [Bacteroidales bacterium]|nr:twin-arginine translocase TatA/TatE family subunit [Bacteroidales bacterium]
MKLLFIGTTELLLISGIALLLFGGKKLPEMMKGLGQGVQSFKKGMSDPMAEDSGDQQDEKEVPPAQQPPSGEDGERQ